jgi:GNAT superfamily N-acetyltransferase
MSQIAIRPATGDDAASVADVLLASRAAFLPYAPSPHSEASIRGWVRQVLLPSRDVTVATADARVVGFIAVHRDDGVSWISQLYLLPSHVARGIGTRLLTHVLTTAARPIRLYTFQQNSGARRFYERHGFSPVLFTDGGGNEERCPDVLYERAAGADPRQRDTRDNATLAK